MFFHHSLFSYHLLILTSYDQTVRYQQIAYTQTDHFSQIQALQLYTGRFCVQKITMSISL